MSQYRENHIDLTGLNPGRPRKDFTTVNFDFPDHYRPRVDLERAP